MAAQPPSPTATTDALEAHLDAAVPLKTQHMGLHVLDSATDTSRDTRDTLLPPVAQKASPPETWLPIGRRALGVWHDITHAAHADWDALPGVSEQPFALQAAWAGLTWGRVLSDGVSVHASACDILPASEAPADAPAVDAETAVPLHFTPSPASPRVFANGAGMLCDAMHAVAVKQDLDTALVLTRPVGAALPAQRDDAPAGGLGAPFNAVSRAIADLREEAPELPLAVLSVGAALPVGTLAAIAEDPHAVAVCLHAPDVSEALPTAWSGGADVTRPAPNGRRLVVPLTWSATQDDVAEVLEGTALPFLAAFQPEVVLVVVSDAWRPSTPPSAVTVPLLPTLWGMAAQVALTVSPRVVAVTDTLMRPHAAAHATAVLGHVLQGRRLGFAKLGSKDRAADTPFAVDTTIADATRAWREALQPGMPHALPSTTLDTPMRALLQRKTEEEEAEERERMAKARAENMAVIEALRRGNKDASTAKTTEPAAKTTEPAAE